MERETIAVSGMSCGGCEETVENTLRTLEDVRRAEADHEADTVEVVHEQGAGEDVQTAIERAGYDVAG